MTNPNQSQDQDLRTALEWHRARLFEPHRSGVGYRFGDDGTTTISLSNAEARAILAAPPRPVDAERVETVTLPASDYRTLVAALEADDTFVTCEICGAWLTAEENSHGADINACWARAVEGGDKASCRSYRASPAHSPDKAVTRERKLIEALTVAASRMEVASVDWGISAALATDKLTHADDMAEWAKDARDALAALAPKPTGTEAGRGVGADKWREKSADEVLAEMITVATAEDGSSLAEEWPLDCRTQIDLWQASLQPALGHHDGFPSRPSPTPPDAAIEALKFYADPKNWIDTPPWEGDPEMVTEKGIPVDHSQDGSPLDCGDRARKALAALTPSAPIAAPVRERVRHLKRGTEYEVLGEAEAQVSNGDSDRFGDWIGLYEGHKLVVYRCVETGKLWCRRPEEFRDGRFVTLVPGDAQTQEGGR